MYAVKSVFIVVIRVIRSGDQNKQVIHTDLSGLRSLSAADNDLEVCGVSALISALPGGLTRLNLSGTCRHTSIVQALQQSTQEFSEVIECM